MRQDQYDKLQRLAALKASETLNEQEFKREKARVLSELPHGPEQQDIQVRQSRTQTPTPRRRSIWWYVFCGPGAMEMHLQYLFPGSYREAVGIPRRRNVIWVQFLRTMLFYGAVGFLIVMIL